MARPSLNILKCAVLTAVAMPATAALSQEAGARAESSDATAIQSIEELIVTAQRREERLQDVPISVSVLTGESLDRTRAQGLTEILNTVPGVAAPIGALGSPVLTIRGVTPSGLAFAGTGTAAVYLDTAPYGFVRSALAPDADIYDLQRIEVLRGPQGTLFGANAQSGVIRILTKDPDLSALEFKARGSVSQTKGGDENYRADLALNVPLIDGKLAARAVVGYHDRSGWIDKPGNPNADDATIRNFRFKVKAQPTDKLSIVGSSLFTRYRADAQSIGMDGGVNVVAADEPVDTDTDVYGLKADYEFEHFTLTSATNYLKYSIRSDLDLSVFSIPVVQTVGFRSNVFSQDLTLNSANSDTWRWSVGASYRDVEDRFRRVVAGAPFSDYEDLSRSWAVFGELTRVMWDGRLEITGGLRYFEDEQRTRENISSTGNASAALVNADATFTALTPRAVLSWHASDGLTVYGSYSQGFRSGLTQNPEVLFVAPNFSPLKPDRLHNYEVGAKGQLWNGRLRFDSAAFYLEWEDVQQSLALVSNGVQITPLVNSGTASGPGVEFSLVFAPTEGLRFSTQFSWNDLTFDRDVISGGSVLFSKGARLTSSPEYTWGGAIDYTFAVGRGLEAEFSLSANYISSMYGSPSPLSEGDALTVVRSSLSLVSPDRWVARLFVDNITNEISPTTRFPFVPTYNALNTRPRTIGVQLEYSY